MGREREIDIPPKVGLKEKFMERMTGISNKISPPLGAFPPQIPDRFDDWQPDDLKLVGKAMATIWPIGKANENHYESVTKFWEQLADYVKELSPEKINRLNEVLPHVLEGIQTRSRPSMFNRLNRSRPPELDAGVREQYAEGFGKALEQVQAAYDRNRLDDLIPGCMPTLLARGKLIVQELAPDRQR